MKSILTPFWFAINIFIVSLFWPYVSLDTEYLEADFVIFFCFTALFFMVGLYIASITKFSGFIFFICINKAKFLFYFILLLAFFSRVIDRFYLRSEFDSWGLENINSIREGRSNYGSNFFSVIAALLYPVAFVFYDKLKPYLEKKQIIFTSIIFVFIILDILFNGSRGTLIYILCIYLMPWLMQKRVILYMFSIVALVFISGIFFYRISMMHDADMDRIVVMSLLSTGYAEFVPVKNLLQIENDFIFYIIAGVTNLIQYLIHGFFEFAYLFYFEPFEINFQPYSFIPQLYFLGFSNEILSNARQGMYYTLFGSLYIAFGISSPLFAFFTGAAIGMTFKFSKYVGNGSRQFTNIIIFLSLFVNSVGGYDGILFLIAIWFVSRLRFIEKRRGYLFNIHSA